MILQTTAADNLTLDIGKDHLQIIGNDHDTKVQIYIDGSKGVAEDYLHATILESSYIASSGELIPIDGDLMLYLTECPYSIEITSNLGTEILDKRHYSYSNNYILIPGVDGRDITAVTAKTGKVKESNQILQARLLLLGTYFEFRENTVPLRLSELPDGVKFILDNCTEASL